MFKQWLYREFWWTIHNMVAHPSMQVIWWLSLFGLIRPLAQFGDWLHEWTAPVEPATPATPVATYDTVNADRDLSMVFSRRQMAVIVKALTDAKHASPIGSANRDEAITLLAILEGRCPAPELRAEAMVAAGEGESYW